ncbi:MAG: TetR/AcrR family transcriptional regulator [Planctomycetes bacterium]|nr:TetR/AcrR family transcriptional regulator [Planctomycetota bacterium]
MTTRTDTREKLIEAAMELFVFQGYGNTGLAQIARKAGCCRGPCTTSSPPSRTCCTPRWRSARSCSTPRCWRRSGSGTRIRSSASSV